MDWIVRFLRSLLVKVGALAGKVSAALLSPAGDPPIQLAATDQRLLAEPIQVWVAGVNLSSKDSNRGRCDHLRERSFRQGKTVTNQRRQWERSMANSL